MTGATAFSQARAQAIRLGARIANYLNARADAYAGAVLYEHLSSLSDVELERRGILRADLHRHVFGTPTDKKRRARVLD